MQTCLSPGTGPPQVRGNWLQEDMQSSYKCHKTLGRRVLLQESEKLVTPCGGRGNVLIRILPLGTDVWWDVEDAMGSASPEPWKLVQMLVEHV